MKSDLLDLYLQDRAKSVVAFRDEKPEHGTELMGGDHAVVLVLRELLGVSEGIETELRELRHAVSGIKLVTSPLSVPDVVGPCIVAFAIGAIFSAVIGLLLSGGSW